MGGPLVAARSCRRPGSMRTLAGARQNNDPAQLPAAVQASGSPWEGPVIRALVVGVA